MLSLHNRTQALLQWVSREDSLGLTLLKSINLAKDRICCNPEKAMHSSGTVSRKSEDLNCSYGPYHKRRTRTDLEAKERTEDVNSSKMDSIVPNFTNVHAEFSLPTSFRRKAKQTYIRTSRSGKSKSKNVNAAIRSSVSSFKSNPFSICLPRSESSNGENTSTNVGNKEKHTEIDKTTEEKIQRLLRPGVVLLKQHITLSEQTSIIQTCQQLGEGPGGFYRPGYQDGAKLRLHMMCLGLNWDPQTRKYENLHPIAKCKPPMIPHEFELLVQRAMQNAQALIKKGREISNMPHILPAISPDICIVNFYTTSGRLGLHQDRDESRESLQKGLPVVSFSIGDSAEFLYGDVRDTEKAEKILLESGDVLIFGGKSRLIFHGVQSIIPNSAPEALSVETGLRPGRLNLTFRKF